MNLQTSIIQLAENLKTKCPVFQTVYPFAFKWGNKIWQADGQDFVNLSLLDTEGAYFYLRLRSALRYEPRPIKASCGKVYGLRVSLRLAALVPNADRYKLSAYLQNALVQTEELTLEAAELDAQTILAEEIGLKNPIDLKNIALVAFDFSLSLPVIPDACLPNPCHDLLC